MKKFPKIFLVGFMLVAVEGAAAERLNQAVVLGSATVADWVSTGRERELNPVLGQERWRQAVVMGVSSAGVYWVSGKVRSRKWRWIIVGAVSALHMGAASWNATRSRATRK